MDAPKLKHKGCEVMLRMYISGGYRVVQNTDTDESCVIGAQISHYYEFKSDRIRDERRVNQRNLVDQLFMDMQAYETTLTNSECGGYLYAFVCQFIMETLAPYFEGIGTRENPTSDVRYDVHLLTCEEARTEYPET